MYIKMNGGTISGDGNLVVNRGGVMKIESMPSGIITSTGVSVWNNGGTMYVSNVHIDGPTSIINYLENGTDNGIVEINNGTVADGLLTNHSTMRLYGSCTIKQSNTEESTLWNMGNISVNDASCVIEGYSSTRGTVKNDGNFWLNAGRITNTTGGIAVWNTGSFFNNGTIQGTTNF